MPNITLSVDEKIIKKVRKIAVDKDTTLTAMVREFLQKVAESDTAERKQKIEELRRSFQTFGRVMGPRTWRRDDLHDR